MSTDTRILIHTQGLELKMDQFSGPMDLLLHMIRENQLNIHDIPICEITEAYLGIIQRAQAIEYEVAGEFLVMASWLLYIKSRTLLPLTDEETQDSEGDPKDMLVQKLIAYEEIKDATQRLQKGNLLGRDIFIREDAEQLICHLAVEDSSESDIQAASVYSLGLCYSQLLTQFEKKLIRMEAEPINYRDFFKDMINKLKLQRFHRFDFSSPSTQRQITLIQHIVLTILVLLELSKRGAIALEQERVFGELGLEVIDTHGLTTQEPDAMPEPRKLVQATLDV